MNARTAAKMKHWVRNGGIVLLVVLIVAAAWFAYPLLEGEAPVCALDPDFQVMGQHKAFRVLASDRKSGLRSITVALTQGEKRHVLKTAEFPGKGVRSQTLSVDIAAKDLGLKNGEALLEIAAEDHSLRKNRCTVTRTLQVDLVPPRIQVLSEGLYLNPGGTGLVIYRVDKENARSSLRVDDRVYPDYPLQLSGQTVRICYFAVPLEVGKNGLPISVDAADDAGNTSVRSVASRVRSKTFRKDTMAVTDRFLEMKMPEFQEKYDNLRGWGLLEVFQNVNEAMREENLETIRSLCSRSAPERMWEGEFLRMKNASTMARFGDRRTYFHDGKPVGESVHNGIDLASTAHAPVEASNHGMVIYADGLGIYGNTVIIDHGQGIFSFYSHLGVMDVEAGGKVRKGDIIGRTDTTGLAGGDHLHFGIFAGRDFVNPQEWWDPHWIRDNVTRHFTGT
ncbi:MAG TPA: M23 family metallopeptidase [Syntrophales bacterium]|nr:M23 family metallopeptidase [Syntrophales bacterium]HQB31546.1 M23 family metallopeptidase [Syntrophales bacterium]HQN78128.1 M23 family metallopeptidase [Syntrophales bacterium]HQQ25908.1 M23 family metallopeptidase [Syntrophales bacterium]